MPDIIAVGEVLIEMMAKENNQGFTVQGEFLGPYPSGAPAIFIDQAARMGASTGMIARVGDDAFGRLNTERLQADGVDISQIKVTPGYTTGTAFVAYRTDGSREFIFHFPYSAAGMLAPEDVEEAYIKDAQYLHIMGCSLSGSESMRQAILKAVMLAQKHGVKISFDPNIRPELLGAGETKAVFEQVLSACDVLLSGEGEALLMTGESSIKDAVSSLRQKGITTIILKNGSKGIQVYSANEDGTTFPSYGVKEVDPTGAGDCFDGAFIASLVEGMSVAQAAQIANAAGALAVTQKGPMEGAFHGAEIYRFMKAHSS